jgi:hypothetical protein
MIRGASFVAIVATLSGCGGGAGAEPARTPDEAASAPEPEAKDSTAESPHAEGAPPDDAAETATEPPSTQASPDDLKAILQLVVDDPELSRFLQTGARGRLPLKVSGTDLPSGVTKEGRPIEKVDGPKNEKDPVLVVTKFEVDGKTAIVSYRYDVEGIRGSTRVSRGDSGWELKSSRIVGR